MKQPQRWRIANNSLHVLEQIYQLDRFPPQNTRNELAKTLNVSARQIQVHATPATAAELRVG